MIAILLIIALLAILILGWFLLREVSRTQEFFRTLAASLNGQTTRLPFGFVYQLGNTRVRIYALQGAVHFRARVRLHTNPGIIVMRKFPKLRFLEGLTKAPGRQSFLFHGPVDYHYRFQAKDPRWMHEIFNAELLECLTESGRVTRIEVKRNVVAGSILMIIQSDEEREKAAVSIEILSRVLTQVLSSTLAQTNN